jgi:hypothetical protein
MLRRLLKLRRLLTELPFAPLRHQRSIVPNTWSQRPGAHVPVEVEPGCPVVLQHIAFPDDFDRIMLLGRYRSLLEQTRNGASGLIRLRDELMQRPEPGKWVSASASDLQSVSNWAAVRRFFCIASGRLFGTVRNGRRSFAILDAIDPTLVGLF